MSACVKDVALITSRVAASGFGCVDGNAHLFAENYTNNGPLVDLNFYSASCEDHSKVLPAATE